MPFSSICTPYCPFAETVFFGTKVFHLIHLLQGINQSVSVLTQQTRISSDLCPNQLVAFCFHTVAIMLFFLYPSSSLSSSYPSSLPARNILSAALDEMTSGHLFCDSRTQSSNHRDTIVYVSIHRLCKTGEMQ